jgi:hypothetical protein
MKRLEKLRKEGPKAFVEKGDARWPELEELRGDLKRIKSQCAELCNRMPEKAKKFKADLVRTELAIDEQIDILMEVHE